MTPEEMRTYYLNAIHGACDCFECELIRFAIREAEERMRNRVEAEWAGAVRRSEERVRRETLEKAELAVLRLKDGHTTELDFYAGYCDGINDAAARVCSLSVQTKG